MPPTPIAVIQGASRGIGLGLARHLLRRDPQLTVIATSRSPKETEAAILESQEDESSLSKRLRVMELDVTKEETIQSARQQVEDEFGKGNIKCLFNISGILFPEKTVTKVSYTDALETFKVNTLGPLIMLKHFLPLLPRESVPPTKLFPQNFSLVTSMSARVGSIADNKLGGWYSYRSSKAAQNQITKTLSMELSFGNYHAIATGYHPGTVQTYLSGEMGKSRLSKNEPGTFTVDGAIEKMMSVMSGLKKEDSGTVVDWQGKQIPW